MVHSSYAFFNRVDLHILFISFLNGARSFVYLSPSELVILNIKFFLTQLAGLNIMYVFFNRVGQIEESIFEVAVKMDVANLVGGGSTDIRFAAFELL